MALETSVPRAASSLGVVSHVTVAEVKAALDSGEEFAFFDLRDEVPYAAGHILYAAHLPLSRIELQVRTLVPLLGTKVVLTDAGDGEAEQAARILLSAGYTDVRLLIGGNKAWADAGYTLFTGRNVPSIGFFEVVEHELGTPNISAINLKKRLDRGDDIRILDTRPREEFEAFHIPGAINAPGAEILHRLGTLDLKPDTLLVANCAGRTRSILGAQSLINAGVPNPVASLTGGTMEWLIAGYDLERGPGRTAPLPTGEALARARKLAEALGAKAGVRTIDAAALSRFEGDHTRSLFRFDVRTPEEYVAGHRPGFRSAPGGQLSSGLERFVGVKGARIVLHDPAGVRDLLTASW
ncbi:MAG: thiosulfate sulfurtransferase, partial [Bauldia sp.]|nr:thiosulfate sulfurtransferase [Bauldia sp.]